MAAENRRDLPLAGYARVSRRGDREGDRLRSPELQREAIDRLAAAEGLTIQHFDPEIDVSGSKADRAILDSIIAAVKAGELGGIVVAKYDRLSRLPPRERVALFDEIEGAGGVVYSASEQLDTTKAEGRFARDVFLGIARMQWEKYRDEFDRAKSGAMESGKLIGPTPFGYRRTPGGTLEEHPEHGPALREAFAIAARQGLNAAVDYLRGKSFVREGGKLEGEPLAWTTSTVRRLLSKRTYLGEGRYGDLRTTIPALVSRAVWEAAQPEPARTRRPKGTFPLTNLASCAACGRALIGARGGPDVRRMYRCSASLSTFKGERCLAGPTVTADLLEDHVRARLAEALRAHPGYVGSEDAEGELEAVETALLEAEAELDELADDDELRKDFGPDRFRRMVRKASEEVEERRAAFQEAARRAQGQRVEMPAPELVETASLEELGPLLRGALADIVVTRGRTALAGRVRIIPKGAEPEVAAAS